MATVVTPQQDLDQAKEIEHRSAILFISGLGESAADQSADGIATRIAHALNRNATEVKAKFAVLPGANEIKISKDLTLARATVRRTAPDGSTAALDVWHLPTADELIGDYEQSSVAVKVMRGVHVVVRYSRLTKIIFRNGQPAKRPIDRAQLWLVRAMIVLLGAYLVGLLVSLLGALPSIDWVPEWISTAVLAVTGLAIWQTKLVKRFTSAAIQLHCLLDYIGEGESVGALRGQVADTFQHLIEQEEVIYDQIDMVAYSFGSVVALDAVFARADEPGTGFDHLETMVTIGCPFDLVRTYWPSYYTERRRRPSVPKQWINVYSPRDVFGSNFVANDGTEIGVGLRGGGSERPSENLDWVVVAEDAKDITVWQLLRFPGLKAHGLYWDAAADADESVFSPLVKTLYAGTELMA